MTPAPQFNADQFNAAQFNGGDTGTTNGPIIVGTFSASWTNGIGGGTA